MRATDLSTTSMDSHIVRKGSCWKLEESNVSSFAISLSCILLLKQGCTQVFQKAKELVPSQIHGVGLKLQSGLVAQAAQRSAPEGRDQDTGPRKSPKLSP